MPRASSIAATGLNEYTLGRTEDYFSIKPFYIRKSNAEENGRNVMEEELETLL